jgi:cyanate permease
MFIIEGLPAVIWAFFWWRLVDDRPAQVKWLSDRKSRPGKRAGRRAAGHQAVKNYAEAFRSPKVIILALQFFCWSIGVYGFVLWLPSILKPARNRHVRPAGWPRCRTWRR